MKSCFFFLFFLFVQANSSVAQEVRARVLDAGTKQPIPYANIIFGENSGTVTNEEGFFSYNPKDEKQPGMLVISSLGYESVEIEPNQLTDGVILLKPSSIELREVYLSNKNLSPKEIIRKVKENLATNYSSDLSQNRIFFRQTNKNIIRKLDLEVDESTIAGIDQELMDRIIARIPKESSSYKEVLGDLYGNYKDQKLRVVKAADLENPQSTQSLEELTKHLETLFRQNLKEHSFLKIRSGIVGGKIKADELKEAFAEADEERRVKTPEELLEVKEKKRKSIASTSGGSINDLLENMFWMEDSNLDVFQKSNRYEFSLEGFAHLKDNTVYVIKFEPRRRGDFSGKIYVNTLDYGVHRIDFENEKPLSKFSLFGVSKRDDVFRGKMIFVKDSTEKYRPTYLEQESGLTMGFNRPLTIIEKNRVVRGRNKQNELDMDLDFRISNLEKLQLVVYETSPLEKAKFEQLPEDKNFEYQIFKTYNPDFWNGHNILEPNAAIKKFTAIEAGN